MNHFEAQSYIIPFIDGKLPEHAKEDFVLHMKNCRECHEELEINYMLLVGMRQLNDEKAISSDFHQDLEQELDRMQHRVHGKKRIRFSAFSICMGILVFVSGFLYAAGLRGVYAYEQDIRKANQGVSYYSNGFRETYFPEIPDRILEAEEGEYHPAELTVKDKIKRVRYTEEKRKQYQVILEKEEENEDTSD